VAAEKAVLKFFFLQTGRLTDSVWEDRFGVRGRGDHSPMPQTDMLTDKE
jgi:hypothetical protein